MASRPPEGPSEHERENPGETGGNPTGVSTDVPAEGDDDTPPPEPGSPDTSKPGS